MPKGTGGSNPSLSANYTAVEKYPRGRRGSPAKGVGWVDCREGSNPSFSATKRPPLDIKSEVVAFLLRSGNTKGPPLRAPEIYILNVRIILYFGLIYLALRACF